MTASGDVGVHSSMYRELNEGDKVRDLPRHTEAMKTVAQNISLRSYFGVPVTTVTGGGLE